MAEEDLRQPKPWCDRCHRIYGKGRWYPSFFKDEYICDKCDDEEAKVISQLVAAGKDPKDYEGCGYIPKV